MEDRCVCCGAVIPEGQQVCLPCMLKTEASGGRIADPESGCGKKPDKLAQEAAAARAAGMSYGKWKSLQEPVQAKTEIPDGWRVCQYCGKHFKPKTKRIQKYCEQACAYNANYERNREQSAERLRKWRKRKQEEAK